MCYPGDARPPAPPRITDSATGAGLLLTASDGGRATRPKRAHVPDRRPHEIVIYPGEPHGFFELHHMGEQGHGSAAADAWERLLRFVGEQAGTC